MNERQSKKHDSCIPEVNTIFKGEEEGDKISLSMKVVNQGSGMDLDPNGVQIGLEEKRRKSFTPFSQPKITLDAVFNTVCKKCGTKGHLAQDCFQVPGGKSYELLTEEKQEPMTDTLAETPTVKIKEHKSRKSKKRKHESSSSTSSNSPSEDHQRHKRNRMKKKKKKKSHSAHRHKT